LPCVKEIPAEDGERNCRHDAAGNHFHGKSAEWGEARNEQQVRETAEKQSEKAV
jgi:hypothetical protein